jgi:L-amino acid N-acyltransferase YncA
MGHSFVEIHQFRERMPHVASTVENAASRSLLRSQGFREEDIYEKHVQLDGVWCDVVIVEQLLPADMVSR